MEYSAERFVDELFNSRNRQIGGTIGAFDQGVGDYFHAFGMSLSHPKYFDVLLEGNLEDIGKLREGGLHSLKMNVAHKSGRNACAAAGRKYHIPARCGSGR